MTAADPFAHLHDEAYGERFAAGAVGHATLVTALGRPVRSLDGEWWATPDLFDEGLRQGWHALDEAPVAQWRTPRDFEIAGGRRITVPSCWNLIEPEWRHFEGAFWYTRHFDHRPGPAGERVVLTVGAANYAALVFLNGRFMGAHQGGSTPFAIELTAGLAAGANRLQIMVENRRLPGRVPMHHIDWFNYGGLFREVGLLRLPAVFIRQVGLALVPGSGFARLAFEIVLSDAVDGTARVTVPALGLDVAVPIADGCGRVEVTARPELWSPAAPRLYDVQATFGTDRVTERVGWREIATSGTEILLNGQPVWLAGVCVHEDDLALGRVTDEADIRRRFAHARELGCNFLRLTHYPHHELVARLADELGFLLWAEIPVYWAIDFAAPETYADALNQLLELVARDRNRASVVIWGVGNENADTDARLAFMAGLARAAKAADPTRLVAAACLIDRERFAVADRLAAALDVIGLNEYFGWYEPDFADLERLLANSAPDKPVIVSETGADAAPGQRGHGRQLFSEDWQATFYAEQLARLDTAPYVRGMAAWLLYDFRSPRRQTRAQQGFNRKGLIAEDKATKKQAFATLARLYAERCRPRVRPL